MQGVRVQFLVVKLRCHMPMGKKKKKKKTQNIKQKQCCKKFNKDFKNGPDLFKHLFKKE